VCWEGEVEGGIRHPLSSPFPHCASRPRHLTASKQKMVLQGRISAEVVYVGDACESFVGRISVRDKIALVDRGKCSFLQKVRDAHSPSYPSHCSLNRVASRVPFCTAQTHWCEPPHQKLQPLPTAPRRQHSPIWRACQSATRKGIARECCAATLRLWLVICHLKFLTRDGRPNTGSRQVQWHF
jgi:hypothetical protein